jgi:hypothetical protein
MLFGAFTVLIMLIVAYALWREGPLTAFALCVNVIVAGLLAFNFWEPIADLLDPAFGDSFMEGAEDGLAMMLIFLPALMLLRWATNSLASTHIEYPPILYRGGAVVFGLVAGYLVAGFLMCVIQTLPLPRSFWTFEAFEPGKAGPLRAVLPPDVVWLAMMNRGSGAGLAGGDERFDRRGSFELRYSRYRRWDDSGNPLKWRGEVEP